AQLADAPEDQHEKMIRILIGTAAAAATRRLGAELLLGWGDATRAWAVFAPTVATASPEAVPALRRFADRAATVPGPEANRAGAATVGGAGDRLGGEGREALRYGLVRARLARGELDRAEQLLAADSSVDALALKGWVALYRGDLKRAGELFRDAGPYAGERRG